MAFTLRQDQKLNSPLLGTGHVNKPTETQPHDAYVCFKCHRLHNTTKSWYRHWRGIDAEGEDGEPGAEATPGCWADLDEKFHKEKGNFYLEPKHVSKPAYCARPFWGVDCVWTVTNIQFVKCRLR